VGFGDERPTRAAVASIGDRPTVNGSGIWLEVHLFDFDGDLYGRTLSVELWSKLRDEVKFDSIDDLCRQMDDDARRARQVLLAV
jgi:riboflavin kinase/FMN adenylyltransferase